MRSPHKTRIIFALLHLPIVKLFQLPLDALDGESISVLVWYFGEVDKKADRKRCQNCVITYLRKQKKTNK